MSEHERGQVDTSAAEVYDTIFVPALFGRFATPTTEAADHECVFATSAEPAIWGDPTR